MISIFVCIFHTRSHFPEPIGVQGRLFGVLGGRVRAFRRQRGNRVGHGLFSTEKQHLGSSPPYGCVFFLSNNASNRQVSHSKEGRTSQARYTFINLGNLRPSLFSLTHIFPSIFRFFCISPTHTHTHNGHHTTYHQRQARRRQWHRRSRLVRCQGWSRPHAEGRCHYGRRQC